MCFSCVMSWPLRVPDVLAPLLSPRVQVHFPSPPLQCDTITETGIYTLPVHAHSSVAFSLALLFGMHLPLPWAWPRAMPQGFGTCVGGRASMSWLLHASLSLPNSLNPWNAVNYPICAVLPVGSKTQLWEANKRADLEKKEAFTVKDPEGLKGNI